MHPAVSRLGFRGANAEIADSFIRSAQHRGIKPEKAVALVEWYAKQFGPNANVGFDDAVRAFDQHANYAGLDAETIDAVLGWHATVDAAGGNPAVIQPVAAPAREQDARREREILEVLNSDRGRYWRDQNLQDELQQIYTRADPQQVLAAIRDMRSADPDAYDQNRPLQQAERELLETVATKEGTP